MQTKLSKYVEINGVKLSPSLIKLLRNFEVEHIAS
jgi:hypothetical protein